MYKNYTPQEIAEMQKRFFDRNGTKSVEYGIETLKKLKCLIKKYEQDILEALYKDVGKSKQEAYISELFPVVSEINLMLKEIKKFRCPVTVKRHISAPFAKNIIYREPYGVVLMISAWNYPVSLSLIPLIDAVAAGNTVILKLSEYSVHTSALIAKILNENFSCESIYVLNPEVSPEELWKAKYDYVFFTGSPKTGKKVMKEASETLTPVTLELGGKSPCIIDKTADLQTAVKRIVRGKLFNAGQTCIAPDYILVDNSVKNSFIDLTEAEIKKQYPDVLNNKTYPKIINEFHFNRILNLLKNCSDVSGAEYDEKTLKIAPALIKNATWTDEIMKEEIFGPLLPVIGYDDVLRVIEEIKLREKPLACYVFTENKKFAEIIINELSFGGGCVNDCLMQFANPSLPFGGVGNSGLGCYHGKYGFETFSHLKSVVYNSSVFDIKYAYAPFSDKICQILKKIYKY